MRPSQPCRNRPQLRLRHLAGHSRFQPPDHRQPEDISPIVIAIQNEGCPHVGRLVPVHRGNHFETGGHHTDNREGVSVEPNVVPDRLRVGGEATGPQALAEDRHAPGAGLAFRFLKPPAQRGLHAQGAQQAGGAGDSPDGFRPVAAEVVFPRGEGAHLVKGGGLLANLDVIGCGERCMRKRTFALATPDLNEAAAVRVGERIEHEALHDAGNRYGGADADSENEDSHGGEAGALAQHAQGVANVFEERLDERQAAEIAVRLPELRGSSQPQASLAKSLLRGHAAPDVFLREHGKVVLKLLFELPIQAADREQPVNARSRDSQPVEHTASPAPPPAERGQSRRRCAPSSPSPRRAASGRPW